MQRLRKALTVTTGAVAVSAVLFGITGGSTVALADPNWGKTPVAQIATAENDPNWGTAPLGLGDPNWD
ncbi:hypothetical protein [Streptomyces sp. NPDC059881]|uniref:hypothetical protein n=1 Tax=Streptomyces sp. NPDC059881 TaxID=3346986 RepID=UPI003655D3C3